MSQIADGHGGQVFPVPLQKQPQRLLVLCPEDPGKHRADLGHARPAGQVHAVQQLCRDIHRPALGQLLRQLLRPGDGAGQLRRLRPRQGRGQGRGGSCPPLGWLGQSHLQLLQHLAAHCVHGAGRQHQTVRQLHLGLLGLKHRAAGFFQPDTQVLRRQGPVPGRLRYGTFCPDSVSFGGGRQLSGHTGPQDAGHGHRYPTAILLFIGGLGPGKQLLGLRRILRPGAEHLRTRAAPVIAVGEAAAGKGSLQLPGFLLGGGAFFVQQAAIDAGDHRHIFRPLHAALQLQARHAHIVQLLQIRRQIGILQAQRVAAGGLFINTVG